MDPTSSLSEGFSHLAVGDLKTPREAIVRDANRTLTQVSRERDLWTEDDHKALDAVIMKTFSANRKINEEPDLASLLSNITGGDKRLIYLRPDEAEDLLTRQSSINAVLQKAWKDGLFKEIRKLAILWPVVREARCSDKAPSTAQRGCRTDRHLSTVCLA
ncbi:hypothetical protein L208DRAFT_1407107 [Tricholoma matsutake]|nr:hypothetical protein L208DRAFT_1407107 [Tricholoma matsutake 945]